MTIGYIRVSTDKQNLENQKHKILSYAQEQKIIIDEFIEIEISSKGEVPLLIKFTRTWFTSIPVT